MAREREYQIQILFDEHIPIDQKTEYFYKSIGELLQEEPETELWWLTEFLDRTTTRYVQRLEQMTEEDAKKEAWGGKTVKDAVAHILEWDRFFIQAAGQIASGVINPTIMNLKGYVTPDGKVHNFDTVDQFNEHAYLAYKDIPFENWVDEESGLFFPGVRDQAVKVARVLNVSFSMSSDLLEETEIYSWSPKVGKRFTASCGIYLLVNTIEHKLIEHTADLYT